MFLFETPLVTWECIYSIHGHSLGLCGSEMACFQYFTVLFLILIPVTFKKEQCRMKQLKYLEGKKHFM